MNLSRIFKLLFTSFLGQGISVISQLLIPPFFLSIFGLEVYGEWIALSASVNYLGTLYYGVQTYATNEMTILYNGGDEKGAKDIQASACRLLLLMALCFAVVGLIVFLIPVASLLKLRHESNFVSGLTLYLLILQFVVNMMFNLLSNSYMVVGKLHRGNYWASAQRLFSVFAMALALYLHATFPVLATIQLASLIVFSLAILWDVRRVAPVLVPSLSYGSWKQVGVILKPSGHFGLFALAGFLTWQGPVLIIQRMLGPAAVGSFALVRAVFQMSRQILAVASYTIGQDITMLFGKSEWRQLQRLYDLSERVVLFLIPIVSIGSLLLCPFLFTVWLHKRNIYEPGLCLLMAMVSAVLGVKEHKAQFQASSNNHEDMSRFIVAGYAIMLTVSLLTMKIYGLLGFTVTWLVWEIIQTAFVLGLNAKLFPEKFKVTMKPVARLTAFMVAAFALSIYPVYKMAFWGLGWTVVCAAVFTSVIGLAAYTVFGVDEVRSILVSRFRQRFAPMISEGKA
jgi:O-antigen/teichoic acid export membrane protein